MNLPRRAGKPRHQRVTPTSTPTQVAHPNRATIRTVLAALVSMAAMWAVIVEALGLDPGIPWVAASLAVTGAITRLLALPAVNKWITTYLPWLAPSTKEPDGDQ